MNVPSAPMPLVRSPGFLPTLTLVVALTAVGVLLPPYLSAPRLWDDGVRSWTWARGASVLTPYLRYGLRLASLTAAVFVVISRPGALLADLRHLGRSSAAVMSSRTDVFASAMAFILLACLVTNLQVEYPGSHLRAYHEGEWMGLLPIWRQSTHPLRDMFLLHGYGTDLLPAVLGGLAAGAGGALAPARAARSAMVLTTLVPTLWFLFGAMARSAGVRRIGSARLACAAALCGSYGILWTFGVDGLIDMQLRRAVLFWQMAACLRMMSADDRRSVAAWALVLGASLPLGFLWNVGDAAVGVGATSVAFLVVAVSRWSGTRNAWLPLATCATGAILACAASEAILPGALGRSLEASRYWAVWGRSIWTIRDPDFTADQFAWILVVVQATALAGFARAAIVLGPRSMTRRFGSLILLCAVCLMTTRNPLETGNASYFAIADFPAFLLLVDIALGSRALLPSGAGTAAALASGLLMIVNPAFAPIKASERLTDTLTSWDLPDSSLLDPDERDAVARLGPFLRGQPCTYVLGSAASWNYLLGSPSCSRFFVSLYASPPAAQREVIADLQRRRPKFVVHDIPAHELSSGLPIRERLPLLYAWVEARYAPCVSAGGVSLWKLRQEEPDTTCDSPATPGSAHDPGSPLRGPVAVAIRKVRDPSRRVSCPP